jgi:hypothetical protein
VGRFDSTKVLPARPQVLTDAIENNIATLYKKSDLAQDGVCLEHLRQLFTERLPQPYGGGRGRNSSSSAIINIIAASDILIHQLHNYYADNSDMFSRVVNDVRPYKSASMKTAAVEYVILPPLDVARRETLFVGWPNDVWESIDFARMVDTKGNYESRVFSLFKQADASSGQGRPLAQLQTKGDQCALDIPRITSQHDQWHSDRSRTGKTSFFFFFFFVRTKKAGLKKKKKHAQRKGPIESTCPAVACRISPSPTLLLTSDGAGASYSAASVRDIRFAARKR